MNEEEKREFLETLKVRIADLIMTGSLVPIPLDILLRYAKAGADKKNHINDAENTYGYDERPVLNINSNNFYVFNISNATDLVLADDYAKKLDKKADENIENSNVSYALVLHTKACTLGEIYKDIDLAQAFCEKHRVELPIYLSIDELMENEKLDTKQKEELVSAFIKKFDMSKGYLGISGTDSNLVKFNEYVMDISAYDTYVIQDSEELKYTGSHNMIKHLDGSITASDWLANSIANQNLNKSENLVYSAVYTMQDNEDLNAVALKFGLSVNDLKKYNNLKKDVGAGDKILIPNLYVTVNPTTNEKSFTYAVASGIDISLYQDNNNWEMIAEKSDFVILRVSSACLTKNDASLEEKLLEVKKIDKPLGLYFCIEGNTPLDTATFEERFEANINYFEGLCEKNNLTINKGNIPLFIDIEAFDSNTNHLEIMRSATRIAAEKGYSKVGLYANTSVTKAISQEYKNLGSSLANENTILWLAGGPKYLTSSYVSEAKAKRAEENNIKIQNNKETNKAPIGQEIGFEVDNLEELENTAVEGVVPVMLQVTNAANNTGSTNSDGLCDYNYLYNDTLFGDDSFGESPDANPNTIESTIRPVDDYKNPINVGLAFCNNPEVPLLVGCLVFVFLNAQKKKANKIIESYGMKPLTKIIKEIPAKALKRTRKL